MTEGTELSANESLAWQLAYESNDAYDTLQEAQVKRTRYDEIGSIGLEGVTITIDEEIVGQVDREVAGAEQEFELLKGMVDAVAKLEKSPFLLSEDAAPPAPGVCTEEKGAEAILHDVDSLAVVWILDHDTNNDGRVEAEKGRSIGPLVREDTGIKPGSWDRVIKRLGDLDLVTFEKDSPEARRTRAVLLNEEVLNKLKGQERLPSNVLDAIRRRETRQETPNPSGGNPDFLADKGGAEGGASNDAPPAESCKGAPTPESDLADATEASAREPRSPYVDEMTLPDSDLDDASEVPDANLEEDDEGDTEDLVLEETGLEEELGSIRGGHQPARRRRRSGKQPKERRKEGLFPFSFENGGRIFMRTLKPSDLHKLPLEVKLLLGFGQATAPTYSFYKTEEERQTFVLKILNKGLLEGEKSLGQDDMQGLIENALHVGLLHQNGNGIELTKEGFECIINAKHGKAKLGQKHLLSPSLTSGATVSRRSSSDLSSGAAATTS